MLLSSHCRRCEIDESRTIEWVPVDGKQSHAHAYRAARDGSLITCIQTDCNGQLEFVYSVRNHAHGKPSRDATLSSCMRQPIIALHCVVLRNPEMMQSRHYYVLLQTLRSDLPLLV